VNADSLVFFFVCWGAVAATLFVVLYPLLSNGWRRTWIGWALLTSSTALALLLDLSVVRFVFGANYLHSDIVRVTVTFLVAAGASLKLTALLREKYRAIRAARAE
jgi:hypothetical protein